MTQYNWGYPSVINQQIIISDDVSSLRWFQELSLKNVALIIYPHHWFSQPSPLVLGASIFILLSSQQIESDLPHGGLNPAHVPLYVENSHTLGITYNTRKRRADIARIQYAYSYTSTLDYIFTLLQIILVYNALNVQSLRILLTSTLLSDSCQIWFPADCPIFIIVSALECQQVGQHMKWLGYSSIQFSLRHPDYCFCWQCITLYIVLNSSIVEIEQHEALDNLLRCVAGKLIAW